MKRRPFARRTFPLALLAIAVLLPAAAAGGAKPPSAPAEFFGIAPQTPLTEEDARYMDAGGIGAVRIPIVWGAVQRSARGPLDWSEVDQAVSVAARQGLRILPFIYGTPRWLARKPTTLPVNNGRARSAWQDFLRAAVERYGPGGEFWAIHRTEGVNYEPAIRPARPIRSWQIWNEANFFYFAVPVSPSRYAQLVTISSQAIKRADPGAKVILTGLFGRPTASGSRGMPADEFLSDLYRVPGIKSRFDGVALHPYALDTETLEEIVEAFHDVTLENRDRVPLYITEMGWGSQNDFNQVAFEQGIQGQVSELRGAYTYLLENRTRLDVKQVYWFSWKDILGNCNFCDSVGFFRAGRKYKAKPAWHAFVALTGGRSRP